MQRERGFKWPDVKEKNVIFVHKFFLFEAEIFKRKETEIRYIVIWQFHYFVCDSFFARKFSKL